MKKLFKDPYCQANEVMIAHMIDSVCKEVGLVERKGTKVDAQVDLYCTSQCKEEPSYSISPSKEEENIKNNYDKSFDFCSIHVYLQPHDPL